MSCSHVQVSIRRPRRCVRGRGLQLTVDGRCWPTSYLRAARQYTRAHRVIERGEGRTDSEVEERYEIARRRMLIELNRLSSLEGEEPIMCIEVPY
jgi:hypothetical protein